MKNKALLKKYKEFYKKAELKSLGKFVSAEFLAMELEIDIGEIQLYLMMGVMGNEILSQTEKDNVTRYKLTTDPRLHLMYIDAEIEHLRHRTITLEKKKKYFLEKLEQKPTK